MGLTGYSVNGEGSDPWVAAVGKLMINFGGLELVAFYWVREFADSPAVQDLALGLPLSKRIDLLLSLARESDLPSSLRREFIASWREVKEIAKLRNIFAHSPIVIGWHGNEVGPPDEVGVLAIGRTKGKQPRVAPVMGLEPLNQCVDRSAYLAQRLGDLLKAHQDDEPQAPRGDAEM